MTPLRVLAVDDEALALRRIEIAVSRVPGVELIGTARGGREGLEMVERLRPDVLLLDINMAGFGGFDVVEGLSTQNAPLVIFCTAFDQYAVRAFQVSAVDYLLKPLEFDRLRAALDKARTTLRLLDAEERAVELKELVGALRQHRDGADETSRYETEIWAPRGSGFERVLVSDINWVEAERDYVHLRTGARSYLLRETMNGIQSRLDPDMFIRVHRSALVRVDRIGSIRRPGYGRFSLLLTSGEEVPVGRTYVKQIKRLIGAGPDSDTECEPMTLRAIGA
jgi:two-component system LytT family response regulator/two-component system response regulator AlgR